MHHNDQKTLSVPRLLCIFNQRFPLQLQLVLLYAFTYTGFLASRRTISGTYHFSYEYYLWTRRPCPTQYFFWANCPINKQIFARGQLKVKIEEAPKKKWSWVKRRGVFSPFLLANLTQKKAPLLGDITITHLHPPPFKPLEPMTLSLSWVIHIGISSLRTGNELH